MPIGKKRIGIAKVKNHIIILQKMKATEKIQLMLDAAPKILRKEDMVLCVSTSVYDELCMELNRKVRIYKGVKVLPSSDIPFGIMTYTHWKNLRP